MDGLELIAKERKRIMELGISVESDVERNANRQLVEAMSLLVLDGGADSQDNALFEKLRIDGLPYGWDLEQWINIAKLPYKERLVHAGQMIAAEIDRIND